MANVSVNKGIIEKAFHDSSSLKKRIFDAISETPHHVMLFEDIAKYTDKLRNNHNSSPAEQHDGDGHASKKRKVVNGTGPEHEDNSQDKDMPLKTETAIHFSVKEVSFSIPQRKKLRVEMTGADFGVGYLRARNPNTQEIEFSIPWKNIQHALCLPVPEKAQRQYNFVMIPAGADGIVRASDSSKNEEPMVWTIPDGPPKSAHFSGTGSVLDEPQEGETFQTLTRRLLDKNLKPGKLIYPDADEFVSAVPEAHRKTEKAYHVKAFRGGKDGYLFFLSTGIFFGFKKPLAFFAFENIDSISYTSVLQRTFNLNITTRSSSNPDDVQESEFSMIDQADFTGIDAYIKRHGLQDASMAEARRAKKLNINGVKGSQDQEGAEKGEEGEGELQKAQREIEDQEDEEEEDYDPGSEGESDGSGGSSEEEEEQQEEGEGDNLIEDELRSEAEDVEEEELEVT